MLNSLQFNSWVFGIIAYLNIALFEMAETKISAHAAYVEGLQPSGCSPTSRPSSPTSRPTCSLNNWLAEHKVHDSVVHGMRQWQRHTESALSLGALEHRWMESTTKPVRPFIRCVQDAGLVHQVSTQERRGRRGCRDQRSSSTHPRPPRRGRR